MTCTIHDMFDRRCEANGEKVLFELKERPNLDKTSLCKAY